MNGPTIDLRTSMSPILHLGHIDLSFHAASAAVVQAAKDWLTTSDALATIHHDDNQRGTRCEY